MPATAPTPRTIHHHQSAVPLVRKLIAKPTATVETTVSDVARIWASDIDIEGVKASDGATGVKARDVTATKIKIKDIEATGHGADRP